MRSAKEILFRLNQEFQNFRLFLFPPKRYGETAIPTWGNPSENCDFEVEIPPAPADWRRDYENNITTPIKYFRLIPYLDRERAGDHKNIWEPNRHQHLVLLSQRYGASGQRQYLEEIERQLESWWEQNPFQASINWTSALEVAFRAFSWIWILTLVGDSLRPDVKTRLLTSLYQHGWHIKTNLSYYFSPNTHLLGEAVVLHALGKLFPRRTDWAALGDRIVQEQMRRQVRADGSHFEQSTYYHVYALDMFLFHATISQPSPQYLQCLRKMAQFLEAVQGPAGRLPFIGDDDGGRWFHPYGRRDEFGRDTLAKCSLFFKERNFAAPESILFRESGLAVLRSGLNQILFDAGPLGRGSGGHSHSDTLSIVVSAGNERILIDSGTFTYVGNPEWRERFRGSIAHNTIRIDARDQAIPAGPFRWNNHPEVSILRWESDQLRDEAMARCTYGEIIHTRRLFFRKPDWLFVLDRVDGPAGEHTVEQFWHLGSPQAKHQAFTGSAAQAFDCWHSPTFGEKHPSSCLAVKRVTTLPAFLASAIALKTGEECVITEQPDTVVFALAQDRFEFQWPPDQLNSKVLG